MTESNGTGLASEIFGFTASTQCFLNWHKLNLYFFSFLTQMVVLIMSFQAGKRILLNVIVKTVLLCYGTSFCNLDVK